MSHTPTPWVLDDSGYRADGDGLCVMSGNECVAVVGANNPDQPKEANAAFIVRAVNSHAALVEALEAIERSLTPDTRTSINRNAALNIARAAIRAAAKGEA